VRAGGCVWNGGGGEGGVQGHLSESDSPLADRLIGPGGSDSGGLAGVACMREVVVYKGI
jgi:hypothetical protein